MPIAVPPGWTVAVQEEPTSAPEESFVIGFAHLEAACRAADAHAPFDEHTVLTMHGQRQIPHARLTVHDGVTLVGCAVLSEGLEAWYVELATLPSRRSEGIGRALLQAAQQHVASHGGGVLRTWVHEMTAPITALAAEAVVARTLLVLRRSLAVLPVAPTGTRPLAAGERDAWLALSNAAFLGHPENGGWSRQDLNWRMDSGWSDLARWPVLEVDGELVAGVWTKVVPGESTGELNVVAVDPRHQGRGLGSVVVGQALHDLRSAGCTEAVLYVDEANESAVRLYRRHGFVDGAVHRCLETEIASSPAQLT